MAKNRKLLLVRSHAQLLQSCPSLGNPMENKKFKREGEKKGVFWGPQPLGANLPPALEEPLDRAPFRPADQAGSLLGSLRSLYRIIYALDWFS